MKNTQYKSVARYAVFLALFGITAILLIWFVSDAILLIFAGILFAAFLDALTRLVGEILPWNRGLRLSLVAVVIAALLCTALIWGGTALISQGNELATTVRGQINNILGWLNDVGIKVVPDSVQAASAAVDSSARKSPTLRSVLPSAARLFGPAWTAIATVLGAAGDLLVIIFLGLFIAAQPLVYRDALVLMVPEQRKRYFRETLDKIGETLRNWLLGQSITMVILGTFVWLGLLIVGVGPALFLGILSGVLAFVPTFGPILAGTAILLAGLSKGLWGVLSALAIYLAIQTAESYILTPLIQRRAISVPPAILFASQILLGVLFGTYGLALATPIAAVVRVVMLSYYLPTVGAKTFSQQEHRSGLL